MPRAARPATVTVRTKGGDIFRKTGTKSRGNATWPLTKDEVHGKFRDCAERNFGRDKTAEALAILTSLEEHFDDSNWLDASVVVLPAVLAEAERTPAHVPTGLTGYRR